VVRVRRRKTDVAVSLDAAERALLDNLAGQVAELLDPSDGPGVTTPADPLQAALGVSAQPPPPSDDPAVRRLLPDAYRDDAEAAGEYRRLTEGDLRRQKREALHAVRAALTTSEKVVALDPDDAERWLAALTDIRLVLGVRLDVREDLEAMLAEMPPADPRLPLLAAYDWLGLVQELIVRALDGDG
jgi:hypothetical protein